MPLLWDLFSLFPAYAGVILASWTVCRVSMSFPRLRGGDPNHQPTDRSTSRLFPAYAGVIQARQRGAVGQLTFPRLRGGDPKGEILVLLGIRKTVFEK